MVLVTLDTKMMGRLRYLLRRGAFALGGGSARRRFSKIYTANVFGSSESRSGEGSNLAQTETVRRELPGLLGRLGVKTLLDAPCGDFNWLHITPLPLEAYIGIDIVEELVKKNARQDAGPGREFRCLDLIKDPLPRADLILCRDCLVHLTFDQARAALRNFRRSGATYLLTTTFTDCVKNTDLRWGKIWRPLNLQLPPFNFSAPRALINENCTEENGRFRDKCLGLWALGELRIAE